MTISGKTKAIFPSFSGPMTNMLCVSIVLYNKVDLHPRVNLN